MLTKEEIRRIVAERKKAITDIQKRNNEVIAKLLRVPEMMTVNTIMMYINTDDEVNTKFMIAGLFVIGKNIVVPYCEGEDIRLCRLKSWDDLVAGHFGILEPKIELRELAERQVHVDELDIVIVPGIAFDPNGGRVGRGKGYYDRFIKKLPENTPTIGLAFDCQIFDKVPMNENDQFIKTIITETQTYTHR
ncbi:MAG: 5-formyltetrahydrofolate cyclo-ligase [Planctomycetaceae bacterium]|nr:5-formyltetrahydrofolate cyclo-ligase [Planctomycetaceae bacterium]